MITLHQLDSLLGKSIMQICPNGFASSTQNHGAHFVAHVLGYRAGMTCQAAVGGSLPGASLRVDDIFARCAAVGVWSLRPSSLTPCLVFIARVPTVNLATKSIRGGGRTHVGIFGSGLTWHYSSALGKVIKQSPAQFARYYPAPDNGLFYGSIP
jgi:hypothetical protein